MLPSWLTRLILAVGLGTFLFLLWKFDPALVWSRLLAFGWGFAAVIPFQLFDHMINAFGWKLAFPAEHAGRVSFWNLVKVRVAGDGVNYLTPSGNLAGEFVRPAMLKADLPSEVKITSVLVAKAAQAGGQALFVLMGLLYILNFRLFAFSGRQVLFSTASLLFILLGVCVALWLLASRPPQWIQRRFPHLLERSAPVRAQLRRYLAAHPVRAAFSTLFFMLGYAWGALEIWLIAHFMGLELGVASALAIEFLSNLIDAMAFMVPAKIGTQEAGKAAIFAGMGLPADLGFTLGLIRHVREIAWAGLGLTLYARHQARS